MIEMRIGDSLEQKCPDFTVGLLVCRTRNTAHDDELWTRIDEATSDLRSSTAIEEINKHPEIAATRAAYKKCGKDPNRYRPSAEALRRRIVKGQELYRVSTLVDIVNLLSLRSGCSIGAFDVTRVDGGLEWGIGETGEPYEAIGRGPLNIAGLPVVRDETGPIGTPTSDEVRTQLTPGTTELLLNINAFSGPQNLDPTLREAAKLLTEYAEASEIETAVVR